MNPLRCARGLEGNVPFYRAHTVARVLFAFARVTKKQNLPVHVSAHNDDIISFRSRKDLHAGAIAVYRTALRAR